MTSPASATARERIATSSVPDSGGPPPVAWRPVGVVAGVVAAVLLWSAGRYGVFGDELYYLSSGDRLAASFADNGPGVPVVAHLMATIAPGSLVALRFPALLATVVAVVVTALTARELGGGRGAQTTAAIGYATGTLLLGQAVVLSSNVLDIPLWAVVVWLVVRWVRTRDDRMLLLAGLVTALEFQVKWLVPVFWICAGIASLALGPREMLRRPLLWTGAIVVAVTAVPALLWQAAHGWPQLEMPVVVSAEQDLTGGRLTFLPLAVASCGLLGALLALYGTARLLRAPALRPYRFLGVTVLLVLFVFLLADGRVYYPLGMAPLAIAAGAVEAFRRLPRPVLHRAGVPLVAASVALALPGLPLLPAASVPPATGTVDQSLGLTVYGKFGWPELANTTAAAYRALPPEQRARTVVVTPSYWSASAIDQLGGGIPVYSTGRGFWYFGSPPESATTVLYVGPTPPPGFPAVREVATVDEPRGITGDTRGVGVWLAEKPRQPWTQYWTEHRDFLAAG